MTLTATQTAFLAANDIRFVKGPGVRYFGKGVHTLIVSLTAGEPSDITLTVQDSREDGDGERALDTFPTLRAGVAALLRVAA